MINDIDTNFVYVSSLLKRRYKDVYKRLTKLMDEMGIEWGEIENTKDIWVRDYMPIQLDENDFVLYQFDPDYLKYDPKNPESIQFPKRRTIPKEACEYLGIAYQETDLVLDGGNVTLCGDYVVMTNKVFSENGKPKNDVELVKRLCDTFGKEIIFIPWHCINPKDEYADIFGHSDGFFRWCGGNKVLMSNHHDFCSDEAEVQKNLIEKMGFKVSELRFNCENQNTDFNWAYVNYLQVGKKIIVPVFGIAEDNEALSVIKQANPDCEVRKLRMRDIANEGGALHCITWNVKLSKEQLEKESYNKQ
ncbi:MAG: agmatine deiminase family protein [Bacteroidales bacterium]|nr:agmatine deiminase family protein [Bacteroidales bacterium]